METKQGKPGKGGEPCLPAITPAVAECSKWRCFKLRLEEETRARGPPLRNAPAQTPRSRTVCKLGACAYRGVRTEPCSPLRGPSHPKTVETFGLGGCFRFLFFCIWMCTCLRLGLNFRFSGLSPGTPEAVCKEQIICVHYGAKI